MEPAAVAHRLDVGVRLRLERGRDRHAPAEVRAAAPRPWRRGSTRSWSGSARPAGARGSAGGRRRASGAAAAGCRSAPAANTTWSAVRVRRVRRGSHAPVRCGVDGPAAARQRPQRGHRRQRAAPPRPLARPATGSSWPACSSRRTGSRSCTRRTAGSRCAPARRRRRTGRRSTTPGPSPKKTPTGVSAKVCPTPISPATVAHRLVAGGDRPVRAPRRASATPGRSTARARRASR